MVYKKKASKKRSSKGSIKGNNIKQLPVQHIIKPTVLIPGNALKNFEMLQRNGILFTYHINNNDTVIANSLNFIFEDTKEDVHNILLNDAVINVMQNDDHKLLQIIQNRMTDYLIVERKTIIANNTHLYNVLKCWETWMEKVKKIMILNKYFIKHQNEIDIIQYLGVKMFNDIIFTMKIENEYAILIILNNVLSHQTELLFDIIQLYETIVVIKKSKTNKLMLNGKWKYLEFENDFIKKLLTDTTIMEKYVIYLHEQLLEISYFEDMIDYNTKYNDEKEAKDNTEKEKKDIYLKYTN